MPKQSTFSIPSASKPSMLVKNRVSSNTFKAQAPLSSDSYTPVSTGGIWQTNVYGGAGGSPFNWVLGSCITRITTYSIVTPASSLTTLRLVLQGIQVSFDDGKSISIGTCSQDSSLTVQSLDLKSDSISKMYVLIAVDSIFGGDTYNKGCGAICFETIQGQSFSSAGEYTPLNTPSLDWQPVSVGSTPCSNFFPVGLTGSAALAVDSLSFYFQKDALISRIVEDFDYSGLTPSTSPAPINVASAAVENLTGETQEMNINFNESVTSSYTWSAEAGITVGVEVALKTGVPIVAEGKVTVSTELSFAYTWGESLDVSRSLGYEMLVSVPPNSKVVANATASSYKLSGSYTANFTENWFHAGAVTRQLKGEVEGVSAFDVDVLYNTISG